MLLTYVIPFHLLFLFPFTLIFDAIFFPNYSLTMYVLLPWLSWKIFQSCYCTISGKLQVLCSVLFSTCMWSHSLRVNQVGKSWLLLSGFQWFASVITHNKYVNTWNTCIFYLLLQLCFNFSKMFEKMIKFRFNDNWTFKVHNYSHNYSAMIVI